MGREQNGMGIERKRIECEENRMEWDRIQHDGNIMN